MSENLHQLMANARRFKKGLFLPYFCVGYPTFEASLAAAEGALKGGAAALELGVPFSDPISDGADPYKKPPSILWTMALTLFTCSV